MDPINDVNPPAEGIVIPPVSDGTPLPGQPEPAAQPSSEPQPDGNQNVDEKTVPLQALHEERGKRQELQAELEVLKQIAGDNVLFDINGKPVQQHAMPGQHAGSHQPQPINPATQELEKLWESDPRKAVQVEIMAAMSWRDNMEAQTDQQMLTAGGKHADFNQYEGVVRQYVRALPLEQRSKPGVVDLAYYVVKGQNAGTAVDRAKAEMLQKIQAGEQVQGLGPGTRAAPPTPQGAQLTADQNMAATAMGLTPEQYISAIKK